MTLYSAHAPLVLFRSNDICFLGILRSCKAADVPVVVISFTWPTAPQWFSEFSNVECERYEISNPFEFPRVAAEQTVAILAALAEKWGHRLLALPSSDTNLMFLLDNYASFGRYIRLMGTRDLDGAPHHLVDKAQCNERLVSALPEMVPTSVRCRTASDIDVAVSSVAYPAIYKPVVKDYGQTFYSAHNGKKAIECADADTLRSALAREIDVGFDLLVQDKIFFESARDEIPFYLYASADGKILMAGNGIKEEIYPPPFGTAIVLRFAWVPELLDYARKVVAATGYRGILMIEFIRDQKDGRWKVVELNTRHWLFNGFYQRLGLNYTAMLYKDLHGQCGDGLVTASASVQARQFAHLDLLAIAEEMDRGRKTLTLEQYCRRLDGIGGSLTAAFVDPADPAPGQALIGALSQRYGWNEKATQDAVMVRLDHDV